MSSSDWDESSEDEMDLDSDEYEVPTFLHGQSYYTINEPDLYLRSHNAIMEVSDILGLSREQAIMLLQRHN